MDDLIHKFGVQKCKRGASFTRATDATSVVVGEADQHSADGGSEEHVIVVMDSPEMGFHCQPSIEPAHLADLGEVPRTHEEAWEGIPSEQIAIRPTKAMSSRAEHSRPLLPDQLLLYSYIPPQGQAPPMEEVSALGPEGAQEIIKRWELFNRGESPTAHLEQLYPAMLRMSVEVRAEGKSEKYVVSILAYACK